MASIMFMIEGGKVLEMVKEHIAERQIQMKEINAICNELGVDEISSSRSDGTIFRVKFKGAVHPEFCKPTGSHGLSSPKKGTAWHKRFKAQKGYRELSPWIADAFQIPTQLHYKGKGCISGSTCIGNPFSECGFLYLGEDGPYAMWIPDVESRVASMVEDGYEVDEPANSFVPSFDGCRRIEKEEWEILALQHKLDKRKAL